MPEQTKPSIRPSWEVLALVRFVLAMIVVAGHIRWYDSNPASWAAALDAFSGKAAVVGFLLISGFSIAASQARRPDYYLRRRILRIYPLYLVALLFAIALELGLGPVQVPNARIPALGWRTMLGNLFLLQTFVVKPIAFNGPVWSLSVEFFFYICAIAFARMPAIWLWAIVAFSALCFVLPQREDLGVVYFVMSKLNAIRYLWCWLLGYLVFTQSSRVALAVLICGVPLVHFSTATPEPLAELTYCGVALVLCFCGEIRVHGGLAKTMDILGDLSYAVYLIHFPAFIFAYAVMGVRSPALLLAIAMAVSVIAYVLVERIFKARFLSSLVPSEKAVLIASAQRAAL